METGVLSFSFVIGGPEIIMILLVLMLLAAPVLLALILAKVLAKPKGPPPLPETQGNPPTDEAR